VNANCSRDRRSARRSIELLVALELRGVLRHDGQICKPRRGSSSFRGPDRVENFDHLNGAAGFRRFDNGEVAMIEVRRIGEGASVSISKWSFVKKRA
jgi:hypothetical protein